MFKGEGFILDFFSLFSFSGRTSRKVYILYYILGILFSIPFVVLDIKYHTPLISKRMGVLSFMYVVIYGLTSIPMTVRRLHDIGLSGKYFFKMLIPITGRKIFFHLLTQLGEPFENEYGPPPER